MTDAHSAGAGPTNAGSAGARSADASPADVHSADGEVSHAAARQPGRTATTDALARTILLLRDHIRPDIPDAVITEALTGVRVAIVSDAANIQVEAAQHAAVAAALLAARSGAGVYADLPDVPLVGTQAPLTGDRLGAALADALDDLIPGVTSVGELPAEPVDLAVIVGDARWRGRARRAIRLGGDAWAGSMSSAGGGERWQNIASPFGALAAAGLAAGEAFKAALVPLRGLAIDTHAFDLLFTPTDEALVRLAPDGTPPPSAALGAFDCVSGGAIIQSALFALARIPGVEGTARIIEPEMSDLTNLNRYAFLRRSRILSPKAEDLASWPLGDLRLSPVVARYEPATQPGLLPHAPHVLVGVDDIPTRWLVQAAWPEWLGIGATSHYSAMASYHTRGLGCAWCLHPVDDPAGGPIPTVAFVSHWAGLWLAAYFARTVSGFTPSRGEQSVYMTSLRAESSAAVWFAPVAHRRDCPLRCSV